MKRLYCLLHTQWPAVLVVITNGLQAVRDLLFPPNRRSSANKSRFLASLVMTTRDIEKGRPIAGRPVLKALLQTLLSMSASAVSAATTGGMSATTTTGMATATGGVRSASTASSAAATARGARRRVSRGCATATVTRA